MKDNANSIVHAQLRPNEDKEEAGYLRIGFCILAVLCGLFAVSQLLIVLLKEPIEPKSYDGPQLMLIPATIYLMAERDIDGRQRTVHKGDWCEVQEGNVMRVVGYAHNYGLLARYEEAGSGPWHYDASFCPAGTVFLLSLRNIAGWKEADAAMTGLSKEDASRNAAIDMILESEKSKGPVSHLATSPKK